MNKAGFYTFTAKFYYTENFPPEDSFAKLIPEKLWKPTVIFSYDNDEMNTNGFEFEISGSGTELVKIEASTNLVEGIWESVVTHTLTDGSADFCDSNATNRPSCCYRLVMPD